MLLDTPRLKSDEDKLHLHFALGKTEDDLGDHQNAFGHFASANRIRKSQIDYDASAVSEAVDAIIATFTADFLAERKDVGHRAPDPIFILGMPRAGSTLIEQILASHSAVEGTMELPDIPAIAMREGKGVRTIGLARTLLAALTLKNLLH